jgi:rhodanese-related sulfurtransferase
MNAPQNTRAPYAEWTVEEVHRRLGAVRLVDVREPHEYVGELGHIRTAELVPLATVGAAADAWDRTQPLVLICRSGARSARAALELIAKGFTQPINMAGGMMAWNAHSLPVERPGGGR